MSINYNLEIQKILLAINNVNSRQDKIKLYKQAINIADSNNDIDWGYDLRVELIHCEYVTSRCVESIPSFAWILNTIDANPDLFDEKNIMLLYKWMVWATYDNPSISIDQIEAVRDDFHRRMNKNGYSSYMHYSLMMQWAIYNGNIENGYKYQSLRKTQELDHICSCRLCDENMDMQIELMAGNFDKAILIAKEIISQKDECTFEPLATYAKLCYYLALNGRSDLFSDFFDKGMESLAKKDEDFVTLINIAYLLFFASRYRKSDALSLFEKYASWDFEANSYWSFYFGASVLPLFKDSETIVLQLPASLPYYKEDGKYLADELYNYFYDRTKSIASQFDKRNGNSFMTDSFNKMLTI